MVFNSEYPTFYKYLNKFKVWLQRQVYAPQLWDQLYPIQAKREFSKYSAVCDFGISWMYQISTVTF